MARTLDQPEIERAILGYLAECPDAMDTLEGIAKWWIHRQHLRFEVEAVKAVLDRLTERGVLARVERRGEGRILYRVLKVSGPVES